MGGLFSIGWTLDDCLDLTWDQLVFSASAVTKHKTDFYTLILESVGGALGVGAKGVKKRKNKKRENASLDQQLASAGIVVEKG